MSEAPFGSIRWGPKLLARAQGTEHFLLVGASGSGKTTLLKMMMRSVFSAGEFTGLAYDPKQELLPILFALRGDTVEHIKGGTSSVRVLNPFDRRCCAWELHKDIDSPVSARELATILVPEPNSQGGGEQFFVNAVRDILTGIMLVFINCAAENCRWTFRDLLLAALYQPYLKVILSQVETRNHSPFPMVHRLKTTYLGSDPKTLSNILATISTRLSVYEPVAAAWHKAELEGSDHTFSLKDWVSGTFSDILVLGNDEAGRSSIDPINRAIFQRATELLLARPETTGKQKTTGDKQTWFFLDEVREAGRLDGLSSLLTKGRSKGGCVVLAFQDIEGMRDVYGNEVANELCGQCNNTIILRLNSPSTSQWASELFGKRIDVSRGGGTEGSGLSSSYSFQEQERPFYFTSDFSYLPSANGENGLSGYLRNPQISPDVQSARWHLEPSEVSQMLPKGNSQEGYFAPSMPRDPGDFYLEPWTEADWDRLGFEHPFNRIATTPEEAMALKLPPRLPLPK